MKVITIESSAYRTMLEQIAEIAGYVREAKEERRRKEAETKDRLLNTAQAAELLNVSTRTLQRMRDDHRIEYVIVRGTCRYRLRSAKIAGRKHGQKQGRNSGSPAAQLFVADGRQENRQRKEEMSYGTAYPQQFRGMDAKSSNASTVRTSFCWL